MNVRRPGLGISEVLIVLLTVAAVVAAGLMTLSDQAHSSWGSGEDPPISDTRPAAPAHQPATPTSTTGPVSGDPRFWTPTPTLVRGPTVIRAN